MPHYRRDVSERDHPESDGSKSAASNKDGSKSTNGDWPQPCIPEIRYKFDKNVPGRHVRPAIKYVFPDGETYYEPCTDEDVGFVEVEVEPDFNGIDWASRFPVRFISPTGFLILPWGHTREPHIMIWLPNHEPRNVMALPAQGQHLQGQHQDQPFPERPFPLQAFQGQGFPNQLQAEPMFPGSLYGDNMADQAQACQVGYQEDRRPVHQVSNQQVNSISLTSQGQQLVHQQGAGPSFPPLPDQIPYQQGGQAPYPTQAHQVGYQQARGGPAPAQALDPSLERCTLIPNEQHGDEYNLNIFDTLDPLFVPGAELAQQEVASQ